MSHAIYTERAPTEYRVRHSEFENQTATLQMLWHGSWVVACEIDPDELDAWLDAAGGRLVAEAHGRGRYREVS